MRDAVVIGAGLAGLAAGLRLARGGARVTIVTKGIGGLQLGQGTVDVLGYSSDRRIDAPLDALKEHVASRPTHPYAHFDAEDVASSVEWLKDVVGTDLLVGDAHANVTLPTAVGALRPTSLYQPSMSAGIPDASKKYVIIGLDRLKDFYPALVAENLTRQGMTARSASLDFEIRAGEVDTSPTNHARALDNEQTRGRLAEALKPLIGEDEVVGLPGVLGLNDLTAWKDLQERIGHPIFEIPLQPPSIPGMRLNQVLTELAKHETRFIIGSPVIGWVKDGDRVVSVTISTAGHATTIDTTNVILAAGGFESGALEIDSYMKVHETIFNLPVLHANGQLLHGDFWGEDQPLFLSGLAVDHSMRPVGDDQKPVYSNLYVAGGNLAGATRWREKSGEGIALASALRAADHILEGIA
ncbi:glycerol-3-phosphate dehydrogenase subunit GlpB [Schaalia sp. ZJ405]|uniref:glycerol-3-phosphate dehydrogenase subunit GlpB n=1 Tax=Schaalia sp. ZJ405 TaxID=2709403 RepID=UPI0013ECA0E7|nr:glycerol-3-phosphate dehydrogenase subunit GlpB [Schaalia sp. ZJ405]QPK81940.1 glycerol-3-phosphate dehydrogenase subunit GlpB [Schaalia sp. ZJ405]